MRDSMIFYRSFYESIKELPAESQAAIYSAVFEYSLNFNEVQLSGIERSIFTLIKPQLDANNKRFNNGKKGGRKLKYNQTETKVEPKRNQAGTKVEANNNVNYNDNVNVNYNSNKEKDEKQKSLSITAAKKNYPLEEIMETFKNDPGIPMHWVNQGFARDELDAGIKIWVTQNLLEPYGSFNLARKHFIFWMPNYPKHRLTNTAKQKNGLQATLEALKSGS